ncbi:hypothetical protein [Pyxidicoccus trucidator]|uniref:hypothetical protein n=1 Tax=Pyxidicoccus trucidator TaxID=2709662 RepID=UPI0013D8E845|nr:hypothetical protein [Pyxidicoccus trucidator]
MLTRLTRLEVEGFRSLRDVVLCPRPLEVFLDARGTATRDLAALFTLLRELAEGRLQQHLARPGVLDGLGARGLMRLGLGVDFNMYRVELRHLPEGVWRLTKEELDLHAGASMSLIDPSTDAPHEESMLPIYAAREPESTPDSCGGTDDAEARFLGFVVSNALWHVRQFLRGFRVQPAGDFTTTGDTVLLLEEPDLDLPANALWDRVQSARTASSRSQVLLCTPSVTLADAFDLEEVERVDTADGVSRFQPLVPRQEA